MVASLLANAVETIRAEERIAEATGGAARPGRRAAAPTRTTHVRFFPVDGSTFLDGDYLIKGVAGRILWSLLGQYDQEGRVDFTNREVRLDPTLDLPDFKDNFESRLILLKRRLDERDAPIRIEKTGRGRFRLDVERRPPPRGDDRELTAPDQGRRAEVLVGDGPGDGRLELPGGVQVVVELEADAAGCRPRWGRRR